MGLITEYLDVKAADRILEKIEEVATAATQAREALAQAQDVIKGFTDSIEPTQAAIESRLDHEESGLPALKGKMDETLLPLSGEEIPEQHNPITLMELPQYIFWNESEHPFQFGGGPLCRESGTWNNGEEVIVLIETNANECWAVIWDEKFSEESDLERKKLPQLYNDGSGLRISIRQKTEGDGYHMWSYSFISAERTE